MCTGTIGAGLSRREKTVTFEYQVVNYTPEGKRKIIEVVKTADEAIALVADMYRRKQFGRCKFEGEISYLQIPIIE